MEVESVLLSPGRRPLLNLALGSPLRVKKNATHLGLGAVRSPVAQKSKRPISPEGGKPIAVHVSSLRTPSRVRAEETYSKAEETENNLKYTYQQCRTPSVTALKLSPFSITDFAVGKAIGKGKFGNVYLATAKDGLHGCLPGPVAVKVVSKMQLQQESGKGVQTLMNEVDILEGLDHPNIVRFYGCCEDSRSFYLIMEHLPSGELFKAVRQLGGRVDEATSIGYIRDITAAVAHMHQQGIVHRDIKPENVLISTEGALKLADFGTAARLRAPSDHSGVDSLRYTRCGTPEYLSPEMVAGTGHGCATDMWALGVMIYELLYGCTPFVEYEQASTQPGTPGSHSKAHPHRHHQQQVAQSSTRVCVTAVYQRIVAYDGDLPFPQPLTSKSVQVTGQPTLAVTPRKMDRQSSLIRSVFSPIAAPSQGQASQRQQVLQPSSTPSSARPSSPVALPTGGLGTAAAGATACVSAAGALSARAQRIALAERLEPPSRMLCMPATPTKTSPRPARDSRGPSCGPLAAAMPAQSDAVVSEEAKSVILQLLRPSPAERLTADALLACGWLCAH